MHNLILTRLVSLNYIKNVMETVFNVLVKYNRLVQYA